MMRTQHHGAIIIVEGSTDIRVYSHFVDERACKMVDGAGKVNTIDAIKILESGHVCGVLGIVDNDFWKLDGISPETGNILTTDTHDLETMIIASPALEKVLAEVGDLTRLARLSKPIRELLLDIAQPLGYLRWLSSSTKEALALKFKGLVFKEFVDVSSFTINLYRFVRNVMKNSSNQEHHPEAIIDKMKSLLDPTYDPWQVCSGHDLVEILTIGLNHVFGNRRGKSVTADSVDVMLRLAYEMPYFQKTSLCRALVEWEKKNSGFMLFKKQDESIAGMN